MSKNRIILTGGGTAGHVTPNLALIERLHSMGHEIEYIGSSNGIERELIGRLDIPYHAIAAGKLRRYFDWRNFTDIFRVLLGFLQSLWLMLTRRPDVVFSKGGFVSAPVVWAAWLFRIPVILHESDYSPGLANKITLPFARKICYSFPETLTLLPQDKAILTGIPVREELEHGSADKAREILGFETDKPVLFVIGGSLGSEVINRAVRNALEPLLENFNVVHICGAGNTHDTLASFSNYRQYEYVHDHLKHFLALADVILSRAGATMLFEILTLHKPALLVPLSKKASRGDQILNAGSFEKQGYAMVLEEEKLNRKSLLKSIDKLYREKDGLIRKMSQSDQSHALHKVLDVIEEVIA
ncbi:MAG: undecaprenyldiphospho-muramoylpentapeptide beta-N-acetylglucosaminyltransferase [Gammaproteobacteria bacterium]|nr:MAG: undecaprenyldiphospho-muramoylpentapeptide beta-N-acetylglucosaminyltransferase [Gammaproteobacteria bacterium]